jgi:hypothetical protein
MFTAHEIGIRAKTLGFAAPTANLHDSQCVVSALDAEGGSGDSPLADAFDRVGSADVAVSDPAAGGAGQPKPEGLFRAGASSWFRQHGSARDDSTRLATRIHPAGRDAVHADLGAEMLAGPDYS